MGSAWCRAETTGRDAEAQYGWCSEHTSPFENLQKSSGEIWTLAGHGVLNQGVNKGFCPSRTGEIPPDSHLPRQKT